MGIAINYLADVLPLKRRIVPPFCDHCNTNMEWRNYVLWPKRCSSCDKKLSNRHWLVNISYIIVFLVLYFLPYGDINFILDVILVGYFGLVIVIDLEHRIILHPVSFVGAIIGLMVGFLLHGIIPTLVGGAVGFFLMLSIYYLGIFYVRISSQRRGLLFEDPEALGFGDVILGGIIGLILGWPGILAGLLFSIIIAGIISFGYLVIAIIRKEFHHGLALPYGPFLVIGAVILLYFKNLIR